MHTKYTHNGITWIDIEQPKKEEVLDLMQKFNVHPIVGEELMIPSRRSKVDLYKNYIYLILHFPSIDQNKNFAEPKEIDFIIGKDFLITVRYDNIDPMHTFSRMFEVNSILDKSNTTNHAGFILFYMLRDLYRNLINELYPIETEITEIEKMIFEGKENEMVQEISQISRKLVDISKTLRYHSKTLESLEDAGKEFFGKEFSFYFHSLTGEYYRVYDLLQGEKETLNDLRETNNSLLTTKTNNIIKSITVMAFITIPLTITTSFLSMNTGVSWLENITEGPLLIVIGFAGLISIFIFIYFRFKKWL